MRGIVGAGRQFRMAQMVEHHLRRQPPQQVGMRDDIVAVDADHPLRFERAAADGIKPYVRVRGDLWALVKRALYYDLVALGETAPQQGENWFGVRSGGLFFPISRASEIEGL